MVNERGAASIEFAVVFIIFFMLFYGLVSFAFPLMMRATYEELSAEALRTAVMMRGQGADQATIEQTVTQVVQDSWLPVKWVQPCPGAGSYLITDSQWRVCIGYDAVHQILPQFSFFGRPLPPLPERLQGEAQIEL